MALYKCSKASDNEDILSGSLVAYDGGWGSGAPTRWVIRASVSIRLNGHKYTKVDLSNISSNHLSTYDPAYYIDGVVNGGNKISNADATYDINPNATTVSIISYGRATGSEGVKGRVDYKFY